MDVLWKVEIITGCPSTESGEGASAQSVPVPAVYTFVYDGFELHWRTLVLKTETHKKRNEKHNEPRTSQHVVANEYRK